MSSAAMDYRQVYSHWLRTGRWLRPHGPDGRELKFNPYHDPRNGQFTFAPGGAGSLSRIIVSDREGRRSWIEATAELPNAPNTRPVENTEPPTDVSPPGEVTASKVQFAQRSGGPSMRRGGNSRAFDDPMTLEQAFPGLRTAPGGAVVAAADSLFGFTGPARAATTELARAMIDELEQDIRAINPTYRSGSHGTAETLQGQHNLIEMLRFERAATYLRGRGDPKPLQVETLRYIQRAADTAYEQGRTLQAAGLLRKRLSDQEALGNFIDRQVRQVLRDHYNRFGVDSAGQGPVRVNRREINSSETDLTSRRPDARVDQVAFDVTLTAKTMKTAQVRGFFQTDWRPSHVVIIRPSQLGQNYTYAIPRPEKGQ